MRWLREMMAWLTRPIYAREGNHFCPVCGYKTIRRDEKYPESCHWSICGVCFWEDDDWWVGGDANEPTLVEARTNFATFGAIDNLALKHVHPPAPDTPRIIPLPLDADLAMTEQMEEIRRHSEGSDHA